MKGQQTTRDVSENEMGKQWEETMSVLGHKKGEMKMYQMRWIRPGNEHEIQQEKKLICIDR